MIGRLTAHPLPATGHWLQLTDKKVWERLKDPHNFGILEHCAEQAICEYRDLRSTVPHGSAEPIIRSLEQWQGLGETVFRNIDDILGTHIISKPQIAGEAQIIPIAAKYTAMYFILGGALLGANHYQPQIQNIPLLATTVTLAGSLALFWGMTSLNSIPPTLSTLSAEGGLYHPIFRTVFVPTDQPFPQAKAKRYLSHEYGHRLACHAFNPVVNYSANIFCSTIWEGFADSLSDSHAEATKHHDPEYYLESLRRRADSMAIVYINLAKALGRNPNVAIRDHLYFECCGDTHMDPYIIGAAVMAVARAKHGPTVQRRFLDRDVTGWIN